MMAQGNEGPDARKLVHFVRCWGKIAFSSGIFVTLAIALTASCFAASAADDSALKRQARKGTALTPQARLGKLIFFDKRLSATGQISCSICHRPELAFTDGKRVAAGINGAQGTRNTPSLFNVSQNISQFWDGRVITLEQQAALPFVNPIEHGLTSHEDLLSKLRENKDYAMPFRRATSRKLDSVRLEDVTRALAAYEKTLLPGPSAFDRYRYARDEEALPASAQRGLALFEGRAGCVTCHTIGARSAALTDGAFHSAGIGMRDLGQKLPELAQRVVALSPVALDRLIATDKDIAALGRFVITKNPEDIGKFKTPSLCNVAVTAPYMHDGSVATLEEAVEKEIYYRNAQRKQPAVFTPEEKADLVSFLRALTGDEFRK
jgi:cytochrome c peroxidase